MMRPPSFSSTTKNPDSQNTPRAAASTHNTDDAAYFVLNDKDTTSSDATPNSADPTIGLLPTKVGAKLKLFRLNDNGQGQEKVHIKSLLRQFTRQHEAHLAE